MKEIKLLFWPKGPAPGLVLQNETPLASQRFTGMEEAVAGKMSAVGQVEASTTIDGLLQVQEPSHMEENCKTICLRG